MRLRHIEIFHAVYVTGSVSAAATSLNVSQPTVSKILRHAEDQLGFSLFHREKGRLFPTEKGDLLFKQTVPVFEQINELRKYSAMLASTNMGRLRIAMTPAFSLEVIPKVLAQFSKMHPDIPIEVETQHATEVGKLILNNSTDVGIVFEAIAQPGISVETVGQTEFICVSPRQFNIQSKSLTLNALSDHPLIQLNAKSQLGQMLTNKLQNQNLAVSGGSIIAETYHLAKRLAAQGAGVAIIDKITAYSGQRSGLRFHEISDFGPIRIDVLTRSGDPVVAYKKDFVDLFAAATEQFKHA